MITRAIIHDPFNELVNTIETFEYKDGAVLSDYLPELEEREGVSLVVAVNGKVVKDYSRPIQDEDKIAISAKIEGSLVAGAIFGAVANLGFWGTVGYIAVATAVNLAIGYGMNLLATEVFGPDLPSKGDADQGKDSPTYSWGILQQTETPGNPIPICFGRNRIAGQVIEQYTENVIVDAQEEHYTTETVTCDIFGTERTFNYSTYHPYKEGDFKEYLYMLLAINDGEVDGIKDVRIEGESISNYKDAQWRAEGGTLSDDPITEFGRIVTHNNVNVALNNNGDSFTKTTTGNLVDELFIILSAPRGLYYSNDSGGLDERYVDFKIQFRPVGATSWIDYGDVRVLGKTTEEVRKRVIISNISVQDQYEVKVTRLSDAGSSFREQKNVTWQTLKEVTHEQLIYPGIAKYGIIALATDQLSRRVPRVSCEVTRHHLDIYNPNKEIWETRSTRNPAWQTWYLLNKHHGIHHSRLIYDEFKEWADWCAETVDGEQRMVCSIVLDTQENAWNNAQKIARIGRGAIIRRGTKYGVFVDKPEDTVSHLFTMGNIIEGTFNMQYLPRKDRANAVEITYTDPDADFRRRIVAVYSSDYKDSTTEPKKANIKFDAAIPRSQVIREASFLLNSNKYLLRTIEFEADVDSFACVAGDLVYFQHMVPHYSDSNSGRIVDAGNDDGSGNPYVQLDQEVDLVSGTSYAVLVRLSDDSLIEKTLVTVSSSEITDTLILSSSWSTVPEKYDLYVFGEASTYKKTYRVTSITRAQELARRITLSEYNEAIYTDGAYIIDDSDAPISGPQQQAINVEASEYLTYGKGGDYVSNITVSWIPSTHAHGNNWAVWLEDITTERSFDDTFIDLDDYNFQPTAGPKQPIQAATTTKNNVNIGAQHLRAGHEYRIYVTPLDCGA